MCGTREAYVDGRTDGRRDGRQAVSADQLRAGIEVSGGGWQAKIAMSRHGHGLRGRTDGRAGIYRQSHRRAA